MYQQYDRPARSHPDGTLKDVALPPIDVFEYIGVPPLHKVSM
jgi:hypothetical protein